MRNLAPAVALLAPCLLVGCDAMDSAKDSDAPLGDDVMLGPCYHYFDGPILAIDDASGAVTHATIGQVRLHTFTVDGNARTVEQVSRPNTNVVVDGQSLVCTLPCSLGTESGQWQFTAEAVGYEPTLQEAAAAYSTFVGGCPSYDTGSTHFSITLDEP